MSFWNDAALKPSFWPECVPFENIKRSTKINLRKILHSCKGSTLKERASINYRSRSHITPSSSEESGYRNCRDRSPLDTSKSTKIVIHPESDVDTSNDTFFPSFRQPEIASNELISNPQPPTAPSGLVTLLRAKPLNPILTFTPAITSKVRSLSISELSNRNPFLTDTTLNAFCVSLVDLEIISVIVYGYINIFTAISPST